MSASRIGAIARNRAPSRAPAARGPRRASRAAQAPAPDVPRVASERTRIAQSFGTPPGGPALQARFEVVGHKTDAARALLEALFANRSVLKSEDAEAPEVLEDSRLGLTVAAMASHATDYGAVDPGNLSQLLQFYYRVKREVRRGDGAEEKQAVEAENRQREAWDTIVAAIVENEGGEGARAHAYPTILVGRGASAAYMIESGGVKRDATTLVIGQEQPWRAERGKDGVINHPHRMIDPKHSGKETDDEGLASRQTFSDRVDEVIRSMANAPVNAKVTSVQKKGAGAGSYYVVTSTEGVYFARRVVAAVGIGRHEKPKGMPGNATEFKTGAKGDVPRVMDMDQFQVAVAEGRLTKEDAPQGIVVVGPNAAIDVMSTALRKAFGPLYWIAGKRPFFLKGTDNEFVEQNYDAAMKQRTDTGNQAEKRFSKGGFSVLQHDFLEASTGADSVTVQFGTRKDPRAQPPVEEARIGSQNASLLVYGVGPDVSEVQSTFKDVQGPDSLEAQYDLGLHFNHDPERAPDVEGAIRAAAGQDAEGVLGQVRGILGSLDPVARTGRQEVPPRKLPSVTGLRARKTDAEDQTSLEFVSGSAFRLATKLKTPYRYITQTASDLVETGVKPLRVKAMLAEGILGGAGQTSQALFADVSGLAIDLRLLAETVETRNTGDKVPEPEQKRRDDFVDDQLLALQERYLTVRQLLTETLVALGSLQSRSETVSSLSAGASDVTTRLGQLFDQFDEFIATVRSDAYGHLASTRMGAAASTLPANVVLADQLTTSRALVEAQGNAMPSTIGDAVDFITHDRTAIAAHIASTFQRVPPALANYVTERIVFDRRHLPLAKAPLPRPTGPLGPDNTFHLEQQRKFQQDWSDKLKRLDGLFPGRR